MTLTLAGTALLMGLVGGPHCVAMCGAACGGVIRGVRAPSARGMWSFQAGRLIGYSLAGGAAGLAVQSFAWLSSGTQALQPVWTLFHVAVLLWGLVLLAQARQPAWVEAAGRNVWSRVRPMAQRRGGLVASGALWVFMPCGLLYSALLVASLSGGFVEGMASMALFALGSGISLGLAPSALRKLQELGNRLRNDWGTRIAGGLLALTAAWALWMDVAHRVAQWCGLG
ncbi:sulfite exporter TauE/SafE family protein [Ramlibacter ginsenosidimutans]|uniref:Sulfite exporter TauE/SafE family protein n=1 Tax=Ramlibacter ginsenosidimutans TaxID=502333 RepID=A0A934TYM6_9BURK|nr:sulfite exporter TauE/SafE family protein [Ramlibacter ginsenosidimutans]MBK6009503.1 sulfite exporter TauE/SafE family protein [Ramlibacter ginsenosidimutans]